MILRWYLGGIIAGATIGWIAAKCHQSGLAPVGLLSLGVGLALGYVLAKLAASTNIFCHKRLAVGAVVFALVTVFAEHTWLYHDFRRQWQDARDTNAQVALFRPAEPWSPAEYFHHEVASGRIALWCVDATLIVASAVGVALFQNRRFVVADDAKIPRRPTSDL
jgi:hypothetical protein